VGIRQVIKDEMARRGLTQTALSEMTGILNHRISEFLNEKADMKTTNLQRIMEALDLELRPKSRRRGKR